MRTSDSPLENLHGRVHLKLFDKTIDFKRVKIDTAQKMKFSINGELAGLRQFLAKESPFKLMKIAFYLT